jgi:hypothetical protein
VRCGDAEPFDQLFRFPLRAIADGEAAHGKPGIGHASATASPMPPAAW